MTNCDLHREENPKLEGVKCCRYCHLVQDEKRPANWVCCRVWNMENTYRPSTRPVNPIRS